MFGPVHCLFLCQKQLIGFQQLFFTADHCNQPVLLLRWMPLCLGNDSAGCLAGNFPETEGTPSGGRNIEILHISILQIFDMDTEQAVSGFELSGQEENKSRQQQNAENDQNHFQNLEGERDLNRT